MVKWLWSGHRGHMWRWFQGEFTGSHWRQLPISWSHCVLLDKRLDRTWSVLGECSWKTQFTSLVTAVAQPTSVHDQNAWSARGAALAISAQLNLHTARRQRKVNVEALSCRAGVVQCYASGRTTFFAHKMSCVTPCLQDPCGGITVSNSWTRITIWWVISRLYKQICCCRQLWKHHHPF